MANPSSYRSFETPKIVTHGSVSKPTPLSSGKWAPKKPANDTLKRVQQPL